VTRYLEWPRRVLNGQLGVGSELWADVSAHPAAARLEAVAQSHGRTVDPDEIAYHITRSLLLDVIHAAGGVEYTVERLLSALHEVQQWTDGWVDVLPPPDREPPEEGSWVGAGRWDVSFEVSNLLVWARTLGERLENKINQGGVEVKIGLLPALAQGDLKHQVARFHDELARWLRAEGYLANYTLHVGRLHGGTPMLRLDTDGQARFLLPDRPAGRIWSWEEFTYRQNRDARAVGEDLLRRVEHFMDGLLASFELHRPERFRPPAPAPS
jgi:hypothetical protein